MKKGKLVFENDEKKSIIIALVISAVVVLAAVLAFVAIKKHSEKPTVTTEDIQEEETVTDGEVTVTTQEELEKALKKEGELSVILQTEKEQSITVPEGKYSDKTFTVDAPYTEIENKGVFEMVNVNQISANTWKEYAQGNTFVLNGASTHLIVEEGASVGSVDNMTEGATLAIENYGQIDYLNLRAMNSISSVQIDGTVSQIGVYSTTNLTLTGSTTTPVTVTVEYGADGSTLTTSIPVALTSCVGLSVDLQEGAQDSSITLSSSDVETNLSNNTQVEISLTDADGTVQVVAPGETKTFGTATVVQDAEGTAQDGAGTEPEQSTSSGGGGTPGSSGGGGSSQSTVDSLKNTIAGLQSQMQNMVSKDDANQMVEQAKKEAEQTVSQELEKPVIVGFINQTRACAGVEGSVKSLDKVKKLLPKKVQAVSSNNESYKMTVTDWKCSKYSTKAKAGTYTFTATVKNSSKYRIATGVKATAIVYVMKKDTNYNITYADSGVKSQIGVKEYRVNGYPAQEGQDSAYYFLTNKSTSKAYYITLNYYYFDASGNLVEDNTDSWYGRTLQPQKNWIGVRTEPWEDYKDYIVEVNTQEETAQTMKEGVAINLQTNPATLYKQAEGTTVSVYTVYALFLDGAGHAYGAKRYDVSVSDINVTTQAQQKSIILEVPQGADLGNSIICTSGGYVQEGNGK